MKVLSAYSRLSPVIDSIAVNRRGAVRKAKLYYLRERTGKGCSYQKSV